MSSIDAPGPRPVRHPASHQPARHRVDGWDQGHTTPEMTRAITRFQCRPSRPSRRITAQRVYHGVHRSNVPMRHRPGHHSPRHHTAPAADLGVTSRSSRSHRPAARTGQAHGLVLRPCPPSRISAPQVPPSVDDLAVKYFLISRRPVLLTLSTSTHPLRRAISRSSKASPRRTRRRHAGNLTLRSTGRFSTNRRLAWMAYREAPVPDDLQ